MEGAMEEQARCHKLSEGEAEQGRCRRMLVFKWRRELELEGVGGGREFDVGGGGGASCEDDGAGV